MDKKTALEYFLDIKELEVADEEGLTVEDLLPCKCMLIELDLLKAISVSLLMWELDCEDFSELRKYARYGYEKLNEKSKGVNKNEEN